MTGLVAAGAAAVAIVTPAAPAQAYHLLGCKFASANPLYYKRGNALRDVYWNTTKASAGRWNAVNAPTNFVVAPAGRSGNVVVSEWSFADPAILGQTGGPCTNGLWANHSVGFRWSSEANLRHNSTQLRTIGTHELGHAQGLDHMSSSCSGTKSVMVQGQNKWACGWGAEPWADDIAGINALY